MTRKRRSLKEILEKHEAILNIQCAMRHEDGHMVFVEMNAWPTFSTNGIFTGYRGTESDITSKRAIGTGPRIYEETGGSIPDRGPGEGC